MINRTLRQCQLRLPTLAVSVLLMTISIPLALSQTTAPAAGSAPPARFHEPRPLQFDDHAGFEQIFDGKSLADWEGDPTVWRVQDGAMVGESSKEKPVFNTYIWRKGLEVKNFDLKLEIKCELGGGSGIQYRSQVGQPWLRPLHPGEKPRNLNWMMTGPQADIWFPVNPKSAAYTGQFYSENTPLGILAWRGETVESSASVAPTLLGSLGDRDELGGYARINDWNQYEIIARGGVLMHILNGHVMAVLVDDDPASSNNVAGKIGIELESTPARVSVRNIWLRKLPDEQAKK
jgi:hypothetical protein